MSLGEHGGAWLAAVRPTSGGVNATRPPTHPTGRLLFALDCPDDGRGVCEQYQPCSTNGTCEERSIFGYSCRCNNGYIGDGKVCRQVFNPCMYNNGGCAHTCLPRANTVTCSCREGYRLEGRKKCVDVDECSESPCHVGATCKNTDGSFQCTCRDGYTGDGIVCVGATPTSTCGPHVCHPNATCVALRGNFQCVCNDAYKGDGITCREKDPCEHAGHACGQNAACRPTANGHACQCVPGYVLLGGACAKRIPSSTVPVVSQEKIVAVVATEI